MERFSLEVKVGIVVVIAAAMVLAFIFILGEWNPFTNTYRITVTLNYAGGIKPGSEVHLAGAKVGKVDSIRYLAAPEGEEDPAVIGLELQIDKRAQELIREDSAFAVQMESLLGGKMVEITPGSGDKKVLTEGAEIRGIDPPRLEVLINEGVSILEDLKAFMESLTPEDREKIRKLLATASTFGPEDVENAKRALKNTADATEELNALVREVRPEVEPLLYDARTALEEVEPTLRDARRLIAKLDRTVGELREMAPRDTAATRAKVEDLLDTADDLRRVADRLDRFTARMEDELSDVDKEELERVIRQFLQQEGVTINVKKVMTDPGYPPPPGTGEAEPSDKEKEHRWKLP